MGTTYEYTYEYEVTDSNKHNRNTTGNMGEFNQRTTRQPTHLGVAAPHTSRTHIMDSLANLQHDRIWHKLYDPVELNKVAHETEIQKMARRQDRRVIKIEASYGSDRQTFIVKRNYDLRVRDVQEEAAKAFRIPLEQIILYWKGRNICETPNELLETLGIENNHTMRICRADEAQRNRIQQSYTYSSQNNLYNQQQQAQQQQQQYYYPQQQQQQQQQQQVYSNYQTNYDQQLQQYGNSPRLYCNCTCAQGSYNICNCCCHHGSTNYYQQLTSPTISGPVAATYVVNLQIGFGDHIEGLVLGRPHPITVYDLQVELQNRFNIPVLEQSVSYNGMPLTQFPPDSSLDTLGIINNSFISLWYRSPTYNQQQQQQQQQQTTDYYSPRQQRLYSYYSDGSQSPLGSDYSPTRRMDNSNSGIDTMQNGNYSDVLKLEVFHGSDRHVLILRSSNNLRIMDLMEELQRITTVPTQNQKLYYRGQELHVVKDRTIRDIGIENNAQIRLIGEPLKQRYEASMVGNRPN